MRLRTDVVEEVRDQAESDLGALQRRIMSLRLYVINTYLEAKDRLFFSSQQNEGDSLARWAAVIEPAFVAFPDH